MDSILIIGQSNMAGRGPLLDAPEIDPNSNIYVARNCKWVNLFRPVNPDRKFAGYNLVEQFASLYQKDFKVPVGIIPCADGGTNIDQWQPNEVLFENAVSCAKLCQKTSNLVAILWHQGESDCPLSRYKEYGKKLKVVLDSFRERLGENIPIIIGEIGYFTKNYFAKENRNHTSINKALKEYAQNTPNCAIVSAKGLKDKGDNLHFNTSSLMTFGTRYYKAFKKIVNANKKMPMANNSNQTVQLSEMEKL